MYFINNYLKIINLCEAILINYDGSFRTKKKLKIKKIPIENLTTGMATKT